MDNEIRLSALRLREALEDKGISAAELSRRTGLSKSHISHYMNGTHTPRNLAAQAIAEVLDCNPAWLMGIKDAPRDIGITEYHFEVDHNHKDPVKAQQQQMARLALFSEKLKAYDDVPVHLSIADAMFLSNYKSLSDEEKYEVQKLIISMLEKRWN